MKQFEKRSHGDTKNVSKGIWKTKSGQTIEDKIALKDLKY